MKIRNFLIIVFAISFLSVASAEGRKLSKQATHLKSAANKIDEDQGREFSKWFPKNKSEFNKICNSPKFDELYDCSDIILKAAQKVLLKFPKPLGEKIAAITSELKFDADAPYYLQEVWVGFCTWNPPAFAESMKKLAIEKQKRSFQYMTRGIERDNNEMLDRCIDSLTSSKLDKLAATARSVRLAKPVEHH